MHMCRCAEGRTAGAEEVQVQGGRGAGAVEVRCRGAGSGVEIVQLQSRRGSRGAEMQMCRGAGVQSRGSGEEV